MLHRQIRVEPALALWSNAAILPMWPGASTPQGRPETFRCTSGRLVMKLTPAIIVICGSFLAPHVYGQPTTQAEQRIATARQQIASDPKKAEAYNDLALALIGRAQETGSADYDHQAAEAIAAGLSLVPKDFQL